VDSVRIYIVEEHDSVRLALAERLGQAAGLAVIGHSGLAENVLPDVESSKPDIVLVEVKRSDGMGFEILRQLAATPKPPKLIVLTSYPSEWEREAAARAGASAYLLKDIASQELMSVLSEVAAA